MRLAIQGKATHWRILSVLGEEALSEPYSFAITATAELDDDVSTPADALEKDLLGRSVSFQMNEGDMVRYGIIASVEVLGELSGGLHVEVRFIVRPRVWVLGLRRNTRIFQAKYAHEIVSTVLSESGIAHRWALQNTYQKRVYCTQYQETDLAFIARILAEEGIYYYFDHVQLFTPGAVGTAPGDPVGDAAGYLGDIAAVAGALAPATQSSNTSLSGGLAAGGGLVGIVGDALTAPQDPEADSPAVPGTGKGGPSVKESEVFAFADTKAGYSQAVVEGDGNLSLHYRQWDNGRVDDFSVTSFLPTRTISPGKVELRDYNFRRPLLQHKATLPGLVPVEPAAGAVFPAPLEIYEHHGEYEKPDVSQQQASDVLEQYRSRSITVAGRATSPRMLPGYALTFDQAPTLFRDGDYIPVRVHHEAHESYRAKGDGEHAKTIDAVAAALHETLHLREALGEEQLRRIVLEAMDRAPFPVRRYQNRFEWVARDVVFRPPRPPRIRDAINESAVVVGPPGQTTYQDKYGRVKVQFQWDREGLYDANSSCWIRVAQPWAGAGFGFQFIPRIGMEVIVTFLGGDPDRPIVMGSVYNATHPTPEPLPDRMTRSGIRTQTIPGGNGFNEISFEDSQGVERVYIHAQKDLMAVVNDGHIVNVKGNETTTVSGKQQVTVGDQAIRAVGGDTIDLAGVNHIEQVGGNHIHRVKLDRREMVQGSATSEVKGISVSEVASDEVKVVHGDQTLSVHGNATVTIGGLTPGSKAGAMTSVQGSSYLTVTERVVVRAEGWDNNADNSSIRLVCGDSYLEIKKDSIMLCAKDIHIYGNETGTTDDAIHVKAHVLSMWGKTGTKIVGGDQNQSKLYLSEDEALMGGQGKVELWTKQHALLKLDQDNAILRGPSSVKVLSPEIGLKSGSESETGVADNTQNDDQTNSTDHPLKLLFTHTAKSIGEPIKSARCRLKGASAPSSGPSVGFVREDTTGDDGSVTFQLPPDVKNAHVTVYINEVHDFAGIYDTPLEWDLHIVEDMGAAGELAGARMRLQNLGYSPGSDPTIGHLGAQGEVVDDPATASAVSAFQRQFRIDPSGALDADTKQALDQVFARTYTDPTPPPAAPPATPPAASGAGH